MSAAFSCTWNPNMKPQSAAYAHARSKLDRCGFSHRWRRHGSMDTITASAQKPALTCTTRIVAHELARPLEAALLACGRVHGRMTRRCGETYKVQKRCV